MYSMGTPPLHALSIARNMIEAFLLSMKVEGNIYYSTHCMHVFGNAVCYTHVELCVSVLFQRGPKLEELVNEYELPHEFPKLPHD